MRLSVIVIGLSLLASCGGDNASWTGREVEKRNTVSVVKLTHDVKFDADASSVSEEERARLGLFISDIGPTYGDIVTIEVEEDQQAHWDAVAGELKDLGLRANRAATNNGGVPPEGAARVVITRHVVNPPRCPDWRKPAYPDYKNTASSNFGCATATNLGAMVANPRDLVEGQEFKGPDAEKAADAVRRYQRDEVKEPKSQTKTSKE